MVTLCFGSSDPKYGEPRRVKPVGFTASGASEVARRLTLLFSCLRRASGRWSQPRGPVVSPSGPLALERIYPLQGWLRPSLSGLAHRITRHHVGRFPVADSSES